MTAWVTNHPVLAAVIATGLVYPVLMRALAAWVRPSRMELADLGRRLLARGDLPTAVEDGIRSDLHAATSARRMALYALVLPVMAIVVPIVLRASTAGGELREIARVAERGDTGPDFRRFVQLALLSQAVANPLFTVIVALEVALIAPVAGGVIALTNAPIADGLQRFFKILLWQSLRLPQAPG